MRVIAAGFSRRVPPWIEYADLYQEGYIGLMQARRSFRDDGMTKFATYAAHRIRGAIRDYLRTLDPTKVRGVDSPERDRLAQMAIREVEDQQIVSEHDLALTFARKRLEYGVRSLTLVEQIVIRDSFWNERQDKEIGMTLGVCESRVCQIRQAALAKLRRPF